MNKTGQKDILKKYLGKFPAWFDLRKKELIKDKINIRQWEINMNYITHNYGSIDNLEIKACKIWIDKKVREVYANKIKEFFEDFKKEFGPDVKFNAIDIFPRENFDNLFKEVGVTPILFNFYESPMLPEILWNNQDRNWFLSAYPDVFEYFYPLPNLSAKNIDEELIRINQYMGKIRDEHTRLKQYILSKGKGNPTVYLIRIKDFYRYELKRKFLLSE